MGAVPIEAPPYWRTSPERALRRQGLGNRIGGMGEVLRAPETTREARIRLRTSVVALAVLMDHIVFMVLAKRYAT
jgi:hypothetical protein